MDDNENWNNQRQREIICPHDDIDWSSAHCANWDAYGGIVDVTCNSCGMSGSVRIQPEEIQWD